LGGTKKGRIPPPRKQAWGGCITQFSSRKKQLRKKNRRRPFRKSVTGEQTANGVHAKGFGGGSDGKKTREKKIKPLKQTHQKKRRQKSVA